LNFKFFNKTLKSQAGFSLTEIMVGGGILAGVGLAGATLFKDQKMAQKKIDNLQTLNAFHQNLIRQMNNPFNCNATMKELGFLNASGIAANTSINYLYQCQGTGCADFKKGIDGVSANTSAPLLQKSKFIDEGAGSTRLWNVNNIIFPQPVVATGSMIIRVVYELDPARFPNAPKVQKDILLNARFSNAGQFKECLNSQESSVNNLQNDICKSMTAISSSGSGSTAGAGGGVIAHWDEATQTCVTNGTLTNKLKTCPAGMVIEGIRSDGSVHCKYPSSGLSCPPPYTKAVMKMSGGSLKVVCE
jgi:type II secretory pathway pseudopilin PulG